MYIIIEDDFVDLSEETEGELLEMLAMACDVKTIWQRIDNNISTDESNSVEF